MSLNNPLDISALFSKHTPLFLAPMEDVSDPPFRSVCKGLGADVVITEFINSDGWIRNCKKADKKALLSEEERPAGIQIYGHLIDSMVEAAKLAEEKDPDFIDINAGCWVKKVSTRGAGAGLLKDPVFMEKMVSAVQKAVKVPVTVKTRLGWDFDSINILEVAKRMENAGASFLTVHCRTRAQGYTGNADLSYIEKIKKEISIPLIANGDITSPEIAKKVITEYGADGIMIGRGAIGNPWIFRECASFLRTNEMAAPPTIREKSDLCFQHLLKHIEYKGERNAIPSFRKYYAGYLKGFEGAAALRKQLVVLTDIDKIRELLYV